MLRRVKQKFLDIHTINANPLGRAGNSLISSISRGGQQNQPAVPQIINVISQQGGPANVLTINQCYYSLNNFNMMAFFDFNIATNANGAQANFNNDGNFFSYTTNTVDANSIGFLPDNTYTIILLGNGRFRVNKSGVSQTWTQLGGLRLQIVVNYTIPQQSKNSHYS